MRKNIFDILSEGFDIDREVAVLWDLFHKNIIIYKSNSVIKPEDLERDRTRLLKQACRSREAVLGRALRGCDFTGKHAARAFFARARFFAACGKKCAQIL
jgi:hypothetical protein